MMTQLEPSPVAVSRPLCVDLDGTLIASDLLWESFLVLLKQQPWCLLFIPFWLLRGRAALKQEIARRVVLDPAALPYREDVLALLRAAHDEGRELILATAADRSLAESVAKHLGIFSSVLASDGRTNLRGTAKLAAIQPFSSGRGFDYVGDSAADLTVFEAASESILVWPSAAVRRAAESRANVTQIFAGSSATLHDIFRVLRVHQWAKNALLFVPLLLSHRVYEPSRLFSTCLAFVSFCLTASSVYLLNDLLDLGSDRRHRTKRDRPFASGRLPLSLGLALAPALLLTGLGVALFVPNPQFAGAVALYFAASTAYSFHLKRRVLVDVFTLAGLYTLRVLAGGFASETPVSPWLLAFSVFLFLSLAFVKRYSELMTLNEEAGTIATGRGYSVPDLELLRTIGPASGYLSALVLALYVNSDQVQPLYKHPHLIWLICPLFLYWVTRIWLRAHRGEIHEDPLVATFRDRISYVVGILIAVVAFFAL